MITNYRNIFDLQKRNLKIVIFNNVFKMVQENICNIDYVMMDFREKINFIIVVVNN